MTPKRLDDEMKTLKDIKIWNKVIGGIMDIKRPDNEMWYILENTASQTLMYEKLKSLFKKLAHGAVAEKRILGYYAGDLSIRYAQERNEAIDETHKRIDQLFG